MNLSVACTAASIGALEGDKRRLASMQARTYVAVILSTTRAVFSQFHTTKDCMVLVELRAGVPVREAEGASDDSVQQDKKWLSGSMIESRPLCVWPTLFIVFQALSIDRVKKHILRGVGLLPRFGHVPHHVPQFAKAELTRRHHVKQPLRYTFLVAIPLLKTEGDRSVRALGEWVSICLCLANR